MNLDTEAARWLLAHINDNSALSSANLFISLPGFGGGEPLARADRLRAAILDSIEFLRPPRGSSIRSPEARTHTALWLRYVEGMTVEEVSVEMNLSERQLHRELRAAESKLAAVLSELLGNLPGGQDTRTGQNLDVVVEAQPMLLHLKTAIAAAVATVEPLAVSLGRIPAISGDLGEDRLFVDEGVLHQVLTQILSMAIQHSASSDVQVKLAAKAGVAEVQVGPIERSGLLGSGALGDLERLAASVGMSVSTSEEQRALTVCLDVPLRQPKVVLVVEDSAAAVELYRRCLEPSGEWQVVEVSDPKLAYDVARKVQPALILLDLLMPSTDGWTVLNMLRARDDTFEIPVIVCSVFQDPLLAEALGATAHLRKPISQADLMAALTRYAR